MRVPSLKSFQRAISCSEAFPKQKPLIWFGGLTLITLLTEWSLNSSILISDCYHKSLPRLGTPAKFHSGRLLDASQL